MPCGIRLGKVGVEDGMPNSDTESRFAVVEGCPFGIGIVRAGDGLFFSESFEQNKVVFANDAPLADLGMPPTKKMAGRFGKISTG